MILLHIIESDGGTIEFVNHFVKNSTVEKQVLVCGHRAYVYWQNLVKERYSSPPENLTVIYWPHTFRNIGFSDIFSLISLYSILGKVQFDFCILHSSKAGFLGRLLFWLKRGNKKIIYVPHGLAYLRQDVGIIKKKVFECLEIAASKLSGNVVCTSKSESMAMASTGIKSTYINNGTWVPSEPFPKKVKSSGQPFRIISVGRLTAQKDPGMFNDIALCFQEEERIEFIWVGDGEQRDRITAPNIKLMGKLDQDRVMQELKNSDVYLSTALWEGLPFAVLEAMACSVPLILRNCVGNVDLVSEEINGFVFEEKEKAVSLIRQIMDRPDLLLSMGKESFRYVSNNYNSVKMVAQYESYMKSL